MWKRDRSRVCASCPSVVSEMAHFASRENFSVSRRPSRFLTDSRHCPDDPLNSGRPRTKLADGSTSALIRLQPRASAAERKSSDTVDPCARLQSGRPFTPAPRLPLSRLCKAASPPPPPLCLPRGTLSSAVAASPPLPLSRRPLTVRNTISCSSAPGAADGGVSGAGTAAGADGVGCQPARQREAAEWRTGCGHMSSCLFAGGVASSRSRLRLFPGVEKK